MPASFGAEFTFADRSRIVVTVEPETARIVPRFSTTKKRDESPGACRTSSGWLKRVAPNASCSATAVQPEYGGQNARHVFRRSTPLPRAFAHAVVRLGVRSAWATPSLWCSAGDESLILRRCPPYFPKVAA